MDLTSCRRCVWASPTHPRSIVAVSGGASIAARCDEAGQSLAESRWHSTASRVAMTFSSSPKARRRKFRHRTVARAPLCLPYPTIRQSKSILVKLTLVRLCDRDWGQEGHENPTTRQIGKSEMHAGRCRSATRIRLPRPCSWSIRATAFTVHHQSEREPVRSIFSAW